MNNIATLILAAGKGTRMNSDLAKVLHKINGRPLVHYVIDVALALGSERTILIIGHQREKVIDECKHLPVEYAIQDKQLGTGHAVMMTEELLKNYDHDVLVLSGDVPLLTLSTLQNLVQIHQTSDALATLLTSRLDDPSGYGRVIRNSDNQVIKIVEHKDASEEELKINEINVGIYIFKCRPLFKSLKEVKNDNSQGEYYLPDVVKMYVDAGKKVVAHLTDNFDETRGINTVTQLREAETILFNRRKKNIDIEQFT